MQSPGDAAAEAVLRGDLRAASRLISRIESGDDSVCAALQLLYAKGGAASVIGITGPPGAGKSTLTDQLIARYRAQGLRVAVLAVDPSSVRTGGAILGDRLRMGRHNTDSGVFIRSMAARGQLGGLSAATGDALVVLDALRFDRILVETVGVGQGEIDIVTHADTVIIVQTPLGGDTVQAMKAGLLETGDVWVVNKVDAPAADRTVTALRESLEFRCRGLGPQQWRPPIVKTQAVRGEGIETLWESVEAHRMHLLAHPEERETQRRQRTRVLLIERIAEALRGRYRTVREGNEPFERMLDEVLARHSDPRTAVARWLRQQE